MGWWCFTPPRRNRAKSGAARDADHGCDRLAHDAGNISYELHEVAGQPSTFGLYEQWISEEALQAHLQTEPLRKLKARADELMESGFGAGMRKLKKLRPRG